MLRKLRGWFFSGVALVLAVSASVDASAAQVQVPATHPRLFYGNPARLAQAQAGKTGVRLRFSSRELAVSASDR